MTSLLVSGLIPPTSLDPTFYTVTRENRDYTLAVSDKTSITNEKLNQLYDLLLLKPMTKQTVVGSEGPLTSVETLGNSVYTMVGNPPYYLSVAGLLRDTLYQSSITEIPWLQTISEGIDVMATKLIAMTQGQQETNQLLAQILVALQQSGSAAIVAKLDTLIERTDSLLLNVSSISTNVDCPLTTIGNTLNAIGQAVDDVATKIEKTNTVLDDAFYTPVPYSDNITIEGQPGYINCQEQRMSLIALLFRALYSPQLLYTYNSGGTVRNDYSFIPYLSSLAMTNNTGVGDNQLAPQINKNDPYGPGDLISNVTNNANIYARLLTPSIPKPLQPVTKPVLVYKRK